MKLDPMNDCTLLHRGIQIDIDFMILKITTLVVLLLAATAHTDVDEGTVRLQRLRERSLQSSNRVINFNKADFEEFVMKYPRPYDVVIYFTARTCKFCEYFVVYLANCSLITSTWLISMKIWEQLIPMNTQLSLCK